MTDVKPIVKFTLKRVDPETGEVLETLVEDAPAKMEEVEEDDGGHIHGCR